MPTNPPSVTTSEEPITGEPISRGSIVAPGTPGPGTVYVSPTIAVCTDSTDTIPLTFVAVIAIRSVAATSPTVTT